MVFPAAGRIPAYDAWSLRRWMKRMLSGERISCSPGPPLGSADRRRKNGQFAEVRNQLGLSIPDGFVITTRAFEQFISFNRLKEPACLRCRRRIPTAARPGIAGTGPARGDPSRPQPALRKAVARSPQTQRRIVARDPEQRRRRRRTAFVCRAVSEASSASAWSPPQVEHAYRKVIASVFEREGRIVPAANRVSARAVSTWRSGACS